MFLRALVAVCDGVLIEANSFSTATDMAIRTMTSELGKCSEASIAWMESLLADVVIRNRDRIASVWPCVEQHYRSTLRSSSVVSYTTERYMSINVLFLLTKTLIYC
jgi:hypothetical protein